MSEESGRINFHLQFQSGVILLPLMPVLVNQKVGSKMKDYSAASPKRVL